jgi:hypothetical protein
MVAAFNVVKTHTQNRLNDFFNGLDFAVAFNNPTDPIGAATTLFNERLDVVISKIGDEAPDIATDTATDWVWHHLSLWKPSTWFDVPALLDKDEPIGNHAFTVDEADIIRRGLHEDLRADLRQLHSNSGGAWYVVSGASNATMRFVPGDHKLSQLPEQVSAMGLPEKHFIHTERKCVDPGTAVVLRTTAHHQHWQIIVNYPFMSYTYRLDGQELVGDKGTVKINKVASFPQFDESKFYFIGANVVTRDVTINFERVPVPGAPQLYAIVISNDPADGNFDLHLAVDGLNGTVPVVSEGLSIVGQTVDFLDGFLQGYIACVARSLNEKWVRVKPSIPDHWRTPEVAWNQYQEIVNQLDELHSYQVYDARTIARIKQGIASKLKLEIPGK